MNENVGVFGAVLVAIFPEISECVSYGKSSGVGCCFLGAGETNHIVHFSQSNRTPKNWLSEKRRMLFEKKESGTYEPIHLLGIPGAFFGVRHDSSRVYDGGESHFFGAV